MNNKSKKSIATLFKYRSMSGDSFRHTQDIFLRNRIYLGDHTTLNDPTEGFYRDESKLVESNNGFYYAEDSPLLSPARAAKITCFSEDPRITLMWSHYSNYHRGICLGFRRKKLEEVSKLYKVKYNQRVPTTPQNATLLEKSIKGFQTKSKEWEYEKEWRIISFEESSFISLPPNSISHVIYGVNTPIEDIEWVQDWIKITGITIKRKKVVFSGHAAKMYMSEFDE
ncbi:MAG: DUF2971 domain-containing protein [Methylobacter tundripaludum]|uniref:DUF2971 family protein n=1 Tax=Methylobacter tundripaludum TaxID=173365 RepID=A0A2S6H6U2_9GAMM|nr:DUF2971 domain-containing protein [Methylobacter tundripaludum]MCK9635009.1 DUF2971 domain-containing protein [Methylobacter tundripaludum]PPK73194.1 Protein of unknown function (DUF2971) [Methylobacter tundripaludum]